MFGGGSGKKVIETVLKATDQTGNTLDTVKGRLKELVKSNLAIGAAAIGAGLAMKRMATEAAKAMAAAVSKAKTFQKAVSEVRTLLNDGAKGAETLSTQLQELSYEFGQNAENMAKAEYNVVSAGFGDIAESMEILNVSSRAAIGGVTDVNTAAKLITQTLNAYGKSSEEATDVAGILFSTIKGGVTTFEELAQHLGKVTSTASVAGISFEEVAAAMAAMTKKGINTAEASTALNGLIVALGAASGESAEQLDALGISLDDGLAAALTAVDKAGGDSLKILRELVPNTRALRAAASAGADGAKEMRAQLDNMTEGVNDFNRAYGIMVETLDQAIKKNESAKARLADAAGSTGVKGATIAVEGMASATNDLAIAIEQNTPNLTQLQTSMGQLTGKTVASSGSMADLVVSFLDAGLQMSPFIRDLNIWGGLAGRAAKETEDLAGATKQLADSVFVGDQPSGALGPFNEATIKENASAAAAALEQAAAEMGVSLTKAVFDPEKVKWIDVPLTSAEISDAMGAALKDAASKLEQGPPIIPKIFDAASSASGSDEEFELYEPYDKAMVSVQNYVAELKEAERQEKQAMAAADAFGNAVASNGIAMVRAMSSGASAAKIFSDMLINSVLSALQKVLAKMIAIQAIKLFGGFFSAGGSVPGYASGGTISKAAAGYGVPDGPRGMDSKLIIGMPGEEVVSRQLSQRLDRFLAASDLANSISPFGINDSGGGRGDIHLHMDVARPVGVLDGFDLGESAVAAISTVEEANL